jgi:hypothetical protein
MQLGREGRGNAHTSSFPMWVCLCLAGREGRHFLYGTPAIPIIYFWREGYRKPSPPVSIEITERGVFYGAKRASRWKNYHDGARNLGGVDMTRTRVVSSSLVLTT